MWYSCPASAASQFEAAVGRITEKTREEAAQALARKSLLLSPGQLRARGVPILRLVQSAGQLVLTFPGGSCPAVPEPEQRPREGTGTDSRTQTVCDSVPWGFQRRRERGGGGEPGREQLVAVRRRRAAAL